MWNLEELKYRFQKLTEISESLLYDVERNEEEIINSARSEILSHAKIYKLIGNNPFDLISSLLRIHLEILKQSIRIKSPLLFPKIFPKIYSLCSNRGINDDYFRIESVAIISSIQNILPTHGKNIRSLYEWIFENSKFFIDKKQIRCCRYGTIDEKFIEQKNILLNYLLSGDEKEIYSFISEIVERESLENIYLYILYPILDNLRFLREIGEIPEFDFYYCLSMINRILVNIYKKDEDIELKTDNIVVSYMNHSDFSEFDELKEVKIYPEAISKLEARILTDCLNFTGHKAEYITQTSLIEDMIKNKPNVLIITGINPFNVNNFGELRERLKNISELKNLKIYVLANDHDCYEDFLRSLYINLVTQDLIKIFGGIKNV